MLFCRVFLFITVLQTTPGLHQDGFIGFLADLIEGHDVRVRVERHRDLKLADTLTDLPGRNTLAMPETDPPVAQVMGWKCGMPAALQAFDIVLFAACLGCWMACSHGKSGLDPLTISRS
jgi:hypothetical protein